MAKVLTANVLVTRDAKSLQNLFVRDKIDLNSIDKNKFLISPKNNKYLVSIEYELNFSTDSHKFLVLNFADVDGRFELDYFKSDTLPLQSMLKIAANNKRSSGVDKIYASFGCGEYRKDWSNPMSFELYKADIDIKNGVRYFTLYYIPINSPLFQKPIYFDLKQINPKAKHLGITDANKVLNIEVKIEDKDSYEMILYKFYKKYLEGICATKNVILLIPEGVTSKVNDIGKKREYKSPDEAFENLFFLKKSKPLKYISDVTSPGGNSAGNSTLDLLFEKDDIKDRTEKQTVVTFSHGKMTEKLFESMSPVGFDVYTPLNTLSKALQTCIESDAGNFIVTEENDLEMISFFRESGLISSDDERVVVAGLEFQVNEYAYRSLLKSAKFSTKLMNNPDYGSMPERGNYDERLDKIFKIKNNSSAFSEKILLDELSFKGPGVNKAIDPVLQNLIQKSKLFEEDNIPIFINNLKNSNVISINIDNVQNPYLLALNVASQTASYNELVLAARKQDDVAKYEKEKSDVEKLIDEATQFIEAGYDLSELTVDNIKEILQDRLLLNSDDIQKLRRFGKDAISRTEIENIISGNTDYVKTLAAVIYKFLQDKDSLLIMHDAYGSETDDFRRSALFRILYKIGSLEIKVRTLPYFNMSSIKNVANQLSLLISKKVIAQISPVNNALKTPEDFLDYFSGIYNIVGFKHVIEEDDMYSEFRLIKKTMETL
jgi:hypothetical protein